MEYLFTFIYYQLDENSFSYVYYALDYIIYIRLFTYMYEPTHFYLYIFLIYIYVSNLHRYVDFFYNTELFGVVERSSISWVDPPSHGTRHRAERKRLVELEKEGHLLFVFSSQLFLHFHFDYMFLQHCPQSTWVFERVDQ